MNLHFIIVVIVVKGNTTFACIKFSLWYDDVVNEYFQDVHCIHFRFCFFVQISNPCISEVLRSVHERAVSIDLNPELEEVCLPHLIRICSKAQHGEVRIYYEFFAHFVSSRMFVNSWSYHLMFKTPALRCENKCLHWRFIYFY